MIDDLDGTVQTLKATVLAKFPEVGIAKTRLAASEGPIRAAGIARALLSDLMEMLRDAGVQSAIETDSPRSVERLKALFPTVLIHCGPGATVPEKLHAVFSRECDGKTKVACIMADVLGLTPGLLHSAADQMDRFDVVVGPDDAGGCWFLGMVRYADMFARIESRSMTFDLLRTEALKQHRSLGVLPVLPDLDIAADLEKIDVRQSPYHRRLAGIGHGAFE